MHTTHSLLRPAPMSEKYIFNNPKWFLFQDQGTQRETSLCYEGDSIPPESLWLLTSHVYQDPPVFLRSQIPSSSLLIVRAPLMLLIGVYAPVIMLLRLRSALSFRGEHSCNPAPVEPWWTFHCYSCALVDSYLTTVLLQVLYRSVSTDSDRSRIRASVLCRTPGLPCRLLRSSPACAPMGVPPDTGVCCTRQRIPRSM